VAATQPPLARRLSLVDAVIIGLGSMIGAGVFSVFAPAAGFRNILTPQTLVAPFAVLTLRY